MYNCISWSICMPSNPPPQKKTFLRPWSDFYNLWCVSVNYFLTYAQRTRTDFFVVSSSEKRSEWMFLIFLSDLLLMIFMNIKCQLDFDINKTVDPLWGCYDLHTAYGEFVLKKTAIDYVVYWNQTGVSLIEVNT